MNYPVVPFKLLLPEKGGCTISLIGASRAGKTSLMKYIYNEFFNKHITTLFSYSLQADTYKDVSKKVHCSPEYYPEIVKECSYINRVCNNKFNFCFIFDDIIGLHLKNDPQLLKLCTILRNSDCSTIYSVQDPVLMNSIGRGNVNFNMIFKQNSDTECEKVIKHYLRSYLPVRMSMNEKIQLFKELVDNHHFIFIDNLNGTICRTKLHLEGHPDPCEIQKKIVSDDIPITSGLRNLREDIIKLFLITGNQDDRLQGGEIYDRYCQTVKYPVRSNEFFNTLLSITGITRRHKHNHRAFYFGLKPRDV